MSLNTSVSQPSFGSPSQSPAPMLQMGVQVPALQLVVPLRLVHCVVQTPQWSTSVLRFVSQPLFGFPSQSAKPAVQLGTQAPALHAVVPLAFVHVVLQAPQLFASVLVFASQPFIALPSQLSQGAVHVGLQPPSTHDVDP